ncbi:cytochrome o ubiquinol oxidase subunit IV [Enterovirga sp.]|uniref:cytochrome o ubiquinol oxidase subunit IV n=1 Tax=Enterovirga sp. TaxID=2026350 RepID=UPI002BC31549|nr:cytochrome o ubiquinol oxidase subunit IV [Enterovirga sp.]HMO28968.1 cytochrome o ubiquinol oxidase subunit IV [Enterovirga sp.]
MSGAAAETPHAEAGHGHGEAHHHHDATGHGTLRDYVTGFVLSVILTAIPFWLVMGNVLGSSVATALTVMAFAVVQIVVHAVYFLHMNTRSEGGWTMLAFIFTIIVVVICLSGSLWVMYHLNDNMMPPHTMHDMRTMP